MGSEEGEAGVHPRLPSYLVNIYAFLGEAVFLERSENNALHVPFFEQRIKAGLVSLNAQVTKHNTEAERGKAHQEGPPRNSNLGDMSLIMHRLFQICL